MAVESVAKTGARQAHDRLLFCMYVQYKLITEYSPVSTITAIYAQLPGLRSRSSIMDVARGLLLILPVLVTGLLPPQVSLITCPVIA